jgi:transcriptional regulator with XRE-family HTH domain
MAASFGPYFRAGLVCSLAGAKSLTITADQIKKARALLAWSQDDMAIASGVDTLTIVNLESGKQFPSPSTLEAICSTLETAGAEFSVGNAGSVKLRNPAARFRLERAQARTSAVGTAGGERYFDNLLSEYAIT